MSDYDKIRQFLVKRMPRGIPPPAFGADTPLFDAGVLDSFGVLELVAFVEENFHLQLEKDELKSENFSNLNAIVALIKSKKETKGRA